MSNTQRTENTTSDVVIQQQSRKFLMMDILMSETCWAHKKWNKIASDIKSVFYSTDHNFQLQKQKCTGCINWTGYVTVLTFSYLMWQYAKVTV